MYSKECDSAANDDFSGIIFVWFSLAHATWPGMMWVVDSRCAAVSEPHVDSSLERAGVHSVHGCTHEPSPQAQAGLAAF